MTVLLLTSDELKSVWVTLPANGILHCTPEWRWAFESEDPDEIDERDKNDTLLGNAEELIHYIQVKIHVKTLIDQ